MLKTCAISAGLLVTAMASHAEAGERHPGHGPDGPPPGWHEHGGYDFARAREDWLAECRRRMPRHAEAPGVGPDGCEAFLQDFYARRDPRGYQPYGYGGPMQAYGYGAGCCMPMVMVPVMQPAKVEPDCTETVEYVYEDVPARRQIQRAPRRAPDKRIRIAPDKRTRVN